MRYVMILLTCALLLAQPSLAQTAGNEDPPLNDLLSTDELASYERNPTYKHHIDVLTDALKRYALVLRSQVDAKKVPELMGTLNRLQALAHYALREKLPFRKKDMKSGEVRELEIRIRKLNAEIEDAKSIAPYEYNDEFQGTMDDLARLRNQLLKQLFGPAGAAPEPPGPDSELRRPGSLGGGAVPFATLGFAPSESAFRAAPQEETRYSTEIPGDQFTNVETQKLRDNQDLGHRVGILLTIAETRLAEIGRRMKKQEWTEKEPNPLEFYTPEQMIHAYERAVDAVMINIDEKAKYKLAPPKEIRKALEKLSEKITAFEPQLAPVKELAVQTKDEILYREVLRAEKTTGIARKGALYGLGAPSAKTETPPK
jgi:hypothetical protein